jgi:hypothetical protein
MKARLILTVAAAAAVAVLAGCGSSAPGHPVPTVSPASIARSGAVQITGRQVFTGAAAGKVACRKCALPPLAVKVSGTVTDHGHLSLNGHRRSATSVIPLSRGGLKVRHVGSADGGKGHFSKATCTYANASAGTFTVRPGGTGIYKGASGKGVFSADFTEVAHKNAKGKCLAGKHAPASFTVVFTARGTLKLAAG